MGWTCVLTNRNNNRKKVCCPPLKWIAGEVGGSGRGRGVPVGGFMCWLWWLAVVLVCTGKLEMHVKAGPIYVAVGTCPNSC